MASVGETELLWRKRQSSRPVGQLLLAWAFLFLQTAHAALKAGALSVPDWTALHLAAFEEDEALAQQAIDLGAPVDPKSDIGATPLFVAASVGSLSVAKLLIDAGAKIDAPSDNGQTPLIMAAFNNHASVVKLLLKEGADPNTGTDAKETPLMVTPNSDAVEIARVLIDAGALVDLKDALGETALHEAAMYGAQSVAKLLLEEGADLNATDAQGRMPGDIVCLCTTFTNGTFAPCGARQCSPYDELRTKAVLDEFAEKERGSAPVAASPRERLQAKLNEQRKKEQKRNKKGD